MMGLYHLWWITWVLEQGMPFFPFNFHLLFSLDIHRAFMYKP